MMLINTVILFLQCALPIFILTSLLLINLTSSITLALRLKSFVLVLLFTSTAIAILSANLEKLSQLMNGTGLESFLSICYLIVYFSCAGLFVLNKKSDVIFRKKQLAFITFFILCSVNGANFITYLTHYWTQVGQFESMIVGIILGSGICLSISILFYLILKSADRKINQNISNYFLLFFATGQLMQSIVLLQQVDILSSNQPIWDTSSVITENSEIGQLLMVLFGYETTPSLLQVVLYFMALAFPMIISKLHHMPLFTFGEKV